MGDNLEVAIEHLAKGSAEKVDVKCDYCGDIFKRKWLYYLKTHNIIDKDSCSNCYNLKVQETNIIKYGKANPMHIEEFVEKNKQKMLEKYGVENVFMSEEIKEKIKNTNLRKYGETSFTKTEEYINKTNKTNLEKYGETNHMKTEKYRKMFSGENSPRWKGGIHDERWDRLQPKYKEWRFSVFSRDGFICQKCKEHPNYLEAHHIFNWKDNLELRYDVNNGISFCKECHSKFHSIYGKINNNLEQVNEYIQR